MRRISLKERVKEWKGELWEHKYLILISIGFLLISLAATYFSGNYVDKAVYSSTSDLILDSIPPIDLTFLFIYGPWLVILVLFIHPLFFHVKELHYVIGQYSLLVLVRSFFIILTHLNAPPDAILPIINSSIHQLMAFRNDLFFSGHTAVPFLGFLLFRREKIKIFFVIATIVMGATVLLMHVHYSIDVFAAVFITYGSYKVYNKVFRRTDAK